MKIRETIFFANHNIDVETYIYAHPLPFMNARTHPCQHLQETETESADLEINEVTIYASLSTDTSPNNTGKS